MNDRLIITANMTLMDALRLMDCIERKLLVVCDREKFLGVISIGDIQRALLKKMDLSDTVSKHIRPDIIFAKDTDNLQEIKKIMQQERIESMPIVDSSGTLVDIIEWKDIFDSCVGITQESIRCPVVIMAGGEGKRLRPLTNIIPKPLIPVSEKTIIEEIMDRFLLAECNEFYLSVNYMADTIKNYFADKTEYHVQYVQEEKPLGTAGSLFLVKEQLKGTFFVSNCDILVDVNLKDLIDYHKTNHNIATAVSVLKDYEIPYGTFETKDGGILVKINEKPTYTYQINSGFYILEPEIFEYIQENEFIHITDLFEMMIADGKQVGVFPVPEGAWRDMGNWEEYLRMINGGH